MPVLGAAKVYEVIEGDNLMKLLFDNTIFKLKTDAISMQNAKMRSENQFPCNVLMMVAPQHQRDIMRIPDAFRIDPLRQKDRKVRAYRDLLAGIAQATGGHPTVISLQHQHDLNVNTPKKLGLKCCFITEVRNEDGSYESRTCNNYAARFQAHCPQHSMAVSIQERRLYKGFASNANTDEEFHVIPFGTSVHIKIPNLNKDGYRHVSFTVEYQSVHRTYHNMERLLRAFGRFYRLSLR